MALTETHYEQNVLDERGIPMIEGTTMKVVELIFVGRSPLAQAAGSVPQRYDA
jgi:hypothetical protein